MANQMPEHVKVGNSPIFKLVRKLGEGGFGCVYHGKRLNLRQTSRPPYDVAIKLESNITSNASSEWQFYDLVRNSPGVPKVYHKGTIADYHVTMMELLGDTLEDRWFNTMNNPRKTQEGHRWIMRTAVQALQILRGIHERGVVHRDVKPENFVFGLSGTDKEDKLHIVDFGLSSLWRDEAFGNHIEYDQRLHKFAGTRQYASVHSHLGRRASRRDDLESLAYTLIYLFKGGKLPWKDIDKKTVGRCFQTCRKKMNVSPDSLCGSKTSPFKAFYEEVAKLGFDEDPDYESLSSIFMSELVGAGMKRTRTSSDQLEEPSKRRRMREGRVGSQWITVGTVADPPGKSQSCCIGVSEKDLEAVIKKEEEDNFLISNVVYCQKSWNLVFERVSESSQQKQTWQLTDGFANIQDLQRLGAEGHRTTGMFYDSRHNKTFVVTRKGIPYGARQIYKSSSDYKPPYEWIKRKWKEGFAVTSMTTSRDGQHWCVVMDADTGLTKQVVEMDFTYPDEGVNKRWQQGYHITSCAANKNVSVFVLSQKSGAPTPVQHVWRTNDFPDVSQWPPQCYISSAAFGRTVS